MARDFSDAGAFNVNGQWATAIRYEARRVDGAVQEVNLRFVNGRHEVAHVRLAAAEARELLGDVNYAAIAHSKDAKRSGPTQDESPTVRGELRGPALQFRQVTVPGREPVETENTIAFDSRDLKKTGEPRGTRRLDELTPRDYVVGAAHAAQLTGAGGPALHGVAQAVGALDAAKLAADAARGKDVRAIDAAAAAASVTLTSGVGGPAVQTAAKVAAAAGAADTARRAMRTAETAGQPGTPSDQEREQEQARLRQARATAVPDAVSERFLRVDDKYYFPDRTLAFTDRGTKLKAESNNLEVVRSLVVIAEARGWQAVTVTGTPEFRRQVWREAGLRGIDVKGYGATDLDREELRRAIEQRQARTGTGGSAHERRDSPTVPLARADDTSGSSMGDNGRGTTAERAVSEPTTTRLTGRLIAFGAVPYKFDPKEGLSYYVKLSTDHGERVVWGVDLERALVESQTRVKKGDIVTVDSQGWRPVTVKLPRVDDQGNLVGHREITTRRNSWLIEAPSYFEKAAERAAAFRGSERPRELVQQHPDLTGAVVSLWLGEQFAARMIERSEDRARVVSLVKERLAQALERGEPINGPKLKQEVARHLEAPGEETEPVSRRSRGRPTRSATRPPRERVHDEPSHARA